MSGLRSIVEETKVKKNLLCGCGAAEKWSLEEIIHLLPRSLWVQDHFHVKNSSIRVKELPNGFLSTFAFFPRFNLHTKV